MMVYKTSGKAFVPATLVLDKRGVAVIKSDGQGYHQSWPNEKICKFDWLALIMANLQSWSKAKTKLADWNGQNVHSYLMRETLYKSLTDRVRKETARIFNSVLYDVGLVGVQVRLQLTPAELAVVAFRILTGEIKYPMDLVKVPAGYARWLALGEEIPKPALKCAKRCKYVLRTINWGAVAKEQPQTKWQWYLASVDREIMHNNDGWSDWALTREEIALACKLGIISTSRASLQRAGLLKSSMLDTSRHMRDVDLELPKTRVQMIRITREYHARGEIYRIVSDRKRLTNDFRMPVNGCPPELEEYRIKTSIEMRDAGEELGHCIAGYASRITNDIFFRKGTVCAQVSRGRVLQCYDAYNTVTDASRDFERHLAKFFTVIS